LTQPALFISHGAPDIVIAPSDVRTYLISLGEKISAENKPDAIVIASAHHETDFPEVVSDPSPEMIYDFGGFAPELYEMEYPAPGSPELAERVQAHLVNGGISADLNPNRGFDHGAWTPLKLMVPQADIPVVQVSIQPDKPARHHYEVGRALAPFRNENVLLIGSGHITHNLKAAFSAMREGVIDHDIAAKIDAFTDWMAGKLTSQSIDEVLDWRSAAPFARDNHPSDEHLLPLFFALGAGGDNPKPKRLHSSKQHEILTSDVRQFG